MDRYGSNLSDDVAYLQDTSRHRQRMPLYDAIPVVQTDAWVAPNAALVGDVIVSRWSTIWYGVTIRAELNAVRIGHFSSIGDGTTIYSAHALPHGLSASVNIGKNVRIESGCVVHSCIIDDDCVIGSGAVIGEGARLERGCQIEPNTVVQPGTLIPAGQVWGGNTAKYVRDLNEKELLQNYADSYAGGASNGADAFSLWPHELPGDGSNESESMDAYA